MVTLDKVAYSFIQPKSSVFARRRVAWWLRCERLQLVSTNTRVSTNMKKLINGFGGAIITLLMVASFSLAAGSTAQAQYRQDRNDGRYRRERDRDWRRDRNRSSNVYDRNRNGVDDRYEQGSVYDRNRNGVDD